MTGLDRFYGYISVAAYWLALLTLATIPMFIILLRRDKWLERRKRGLCVRCGYDVRASTDRCPECGEPVPFREL